MPFKIIVQPLLLTALDKGTLVGDRTAVLQTSALPPPYSNTWVDGQKKG